MTLEEDFHFTEDQDKSFEPAPGKPLGRPRKIDDPARIEKARQLKAQGHNSNDIAQYMGVSRATLYRYLNGEHQPRLSGATVDTPVEVPDKVPTDESAEGGAGPLWKADFKGDEGEIQTGALPEDFDPYNFDAVLEKLGYEPGEIRLELTASTRWEQRTAKRIWSEKHRAFIRTGEYETVWLNAYRYKAVKDGLTVPLPALYAEVAKGPLSRPESGVGGPATAVVCWADIQTGKVDHQGGLVELLQRLEEKRGALNEYLANEAIDDIVVADVGDILEGFENTKQQRTTNCLSLQDQVDVAATEFWKTIRICEKYGPVDVLSIPSNHCQWRSKKDLLGKPCDDWGIHINKRLEELNTEAKLDVTFHRPASEWEEHIGFDIRGTKLGLAHGHQATRPDAVKTWWEKMTHGGVLDCHVLLTGHFHFPSLRPSGRDPRTGKSKWHVQAPTLDNGSAWVRNKQGEDGDPALLVFQINDDGFDPGSFRLL